jgi:isopenicillin N synthase-like dioxygenase
MKQTIPVVSLKNFIQGSSTQKTQFVDTLGSALVDVGFFALVDHGVSRSLIQDAYELAEAFFELPVVTKSQYEIKHLMGQRGYTGFGKEHAKGSQSPDLKEFWHVARERFGADVQKSKFGANLWPQELPRFKEVFVKLYENLDNTAYELLKACALYLGLPEDEFCGRAYGGESILRLIHYPPVPEDVSPASLRAAPHEDINLITLLCESTASGLELLDRKGHWLPIHAIPGQIIVDAGDMLQNVTNGFFRSTTHQVVNPDSSKARRFSMPFFCHPRGEARLDPLPCTVAKTGNKLKYPCWTAHEFLKTRLEEIGLSDA